MQDKIVEKYEDFLRWIGGVSYPALLGFTLFSVLLYAVDHNWREAMVGGMVFAGASLILVKALLYKK